MTDQKSKRKVYNCHNRDLDPTKEGRTTVVPDGYQYERRAFGVSAPCNPQEHHLWPLVAIPKVKIIPVPPSVVACGHIGKRDDPWCEGCKWTKTPIHGQQEGDLALE